MAAHHAVVPPSPNSSFRQDREAGDPQLAYARGDGPGSSQQAYPTRGGAIHGSLRNVRDPYGASNERQERVRSSWAPQGHFRDNSFAVDQGRGQVRHSYALGQGRSRDSYSGGQPQGHPGYSSGQSWEGQPQGRVYPTDTYPESQGFDPQWQERPGQEVYNQSPPGTWQGEQEYVQLSHQQQQQQQQYQPQQQQQLGDSRASLRGSRRSLQAGDPQDYPQQQQQQFYNPSPPNGQTNEYYPMHHQPPQQQQQQQLSSSRQGSLRNIPGAAPPPDTESPPGYAPMQANPQRASFAGYPNRDQQQQQQQSPDFEPRRSRSRLSRDFPDSGQVGPRQGSTRSLQGVGARDQRPGSVRSQGGGARNRRSTGSSIYGFLVEARNLDGREILELLQMGFVLLTGGRDTQGGPVVTLPSLQTRNDPQPEDLITCLQYLIQIPSDETKKKGFSVVVDTREGSWANLSSIISCLQQTIGNYLKQILVVLHEHDRRANQDRPSNFEPRFVTINQLSRYIDPKQLTFDLNGQMEYDHNSWLRIQLYYESFLKDAQSVVEHLDHQESEIQTAYGPTGRADPQASPLEALRKHRHFQDAIMVAPTEVIRNGQEVLSALQENGHSGYMDSQGMVPTLDNLESQKQVKRVLQYLGQRVEKLQDFLEDRDRSLNANMQYEEWKRNIKTVVDWVLGPGEKLLASQSDIGDSYEAAEELRRRHEEMEIKCTDTYGQYAELRHTAEEILDDGLTNGDDLKAERDYMDTVCRNFASRLERRRTLLITSVRFHRFAEDFSQSLEELLDLLCSDLVAETVEAVEQAMQTLKEKSEACDTVAEQTMNDGQSLLDEMARPIKNAFGKDISPDYANQIKHINKKLEELQERKMRCDELADVRKLKLQQMLQLRTCERDTDQAIDWINELCDVMVTTHTNMGSNPEEVEELHEEHKNFEATAMGTYEYGKQLLQPAVVLRRSLRFDLEPNHDRARRLEEAWTRFSKGTSERANRLTVSAMFLNESDKLLDDMEDFISACARALAGEADINESVKNLGPPKNQIGKDFDNTTQMGQALLERLALPIILYEGGEKRLSIDEEGASETVSNRLRKLDRKMADSDRFWDELQKAQADPFFQPKTLVRQPSERRQKKVAKPKPSTEAIERKRRSDPFGFASRKRLPSQEANQMVEPPQRRQPSYDSADKNNNMGSPGSVQNGLRPTDQRSMNRSFDSSPGDLRGGRVPYGQRQPPSSSGFLGHQASMPDLSHTQMQKEQPLIAESAHNYQASMPDLRTDSQGQMISPGDQFGGLHHAQAYQQQTQPPIEVQAALNTSAPSSTLDTTDRLDSSADPLYSNQPQTRPRRSVLDHDWFSPMYNPNAPLPEQLARVSLCVSVCLFNI